MPAKRPWQGSWYHSHAPALRGLNQPARSRVARSKGMMTDSVSGPPADLANQRIRRSVPDVHAATPMWSTFGTRDPCAPPTGRARTRRNEVAYLVALDSGPALSVSR